MLLYAKSFEARSLPEDGLGQSQELNF